MIADIGEAEARGLRRTTVPGDWRRPGTRTAYTIAWRDREGFGQLVPRPTAAEAAAAHAVPDYYTHDGTAPAAGAPDPFAWRLLAHLAWRRDAGREADAAWWRALLGDDPKRIVEIGAGHGGTLAMLAGMGHRVTGIEPDPAARAAAAAQGVALLPGRAEALPEGLAPGGYDAVILLHVLEHCTDPARALANAATLAAPGGLVVVEVPNNACNGAAVFGACWHWLDVPRHINFYTPQSLRAAVTGAGLTVERVEYAGYCRQFQRGWAAAQAAAGRALGDPRGASFGRYVWLLARTAFAAAERKYDSVRVTARRALATPTLTAEMIR